MKHEAAHREVPDSILASARHLLSAVGKPFPIGALPSKVGQCDDRSPSPIQYVCLEDRPTDLP